MAVDRKQWWFRLLSALFLLFFLTGCKMDVSNGKTEEPVLSIEPLTGEEAKQKDHPILMVMINNHQSARPQTGLNRADLVVEMLAEGEITRFSAFYHSKVEGVVGPIRSLRPYHLQLAKGFDAISAHAGGSKDALQIIKQENLRTLNGIREEGNYFWRVDFRRPPHNLYTDINSLLAGAKEKGWEQPIQKMPFSFNKDGVTAKGKKAEQIEIVYGPLYALAYRYDSTTGNYVRYTQGEQHMDRETKEPLTMQNVLVIRANHRTIDQAGRRVINLEGSGEGFLFQKGKGIPISWEKREGVILPLSDGKVLPLIPGKTWINIIPDSGRVLY